MALPPDLQIPYPKIVEVATDSLGAIAMEAFVQFLEDEWVTTYHDMSSHSPTVLQIHYHGFTFLYDQASANGSDVEDRLVAAYGWSIANETKKDESRMKGFLGGGIDMPGKGKFDKGHVLAHSMGGGLDINLFPQRPELNRGRSEAGRVYRRMEKYAATHVGTFVFSRMIYCDHSWVPSSLEYGVLLKDNKLWVEWFEN